MGRHLMRDAISGKNNRGRYSIRLQDEFYSLKSDIENAVKKANVKEKDYPYIIHAIKVNIDLDCFYWIGSLRLSHYDTK